MPLSGAQTRVLLADRNVHPIRTVAAPASASQSPGLVVTIDLVFQGVAFKPEDIFDALEAKYGSGKVVSDTDTAQRLPLRLRIVP
jgi:hypothetical protein